MAESDILPSPDHPEPPLNVGFSQVGIIIGQQDQGCAVGKFIQLRGILEEGEREPAR